MKHDAPSFAIFDGGEWQVTVSPSAAASNNDPSLVIVRLSITDDDRVEEILMPFAAALGTVP